VRYALSPYIKQIRFIFKGLLEDKPLVDIMRLTSICTGNTYVHVWSENWKTAEQIEE
jgi:hypothetical protein